MHDTMAVHGIERERDPADPVACDRRCQERSAIGRNEPREKYSMAMKARRSVDP